MNPALIGLIGAAVAAIVAYIEVSRRLSGKIQTSEAKDLWAESAAIRSDYAKRLEHAEERMAKQDERIAKLEERNNDLVAENLELTRRNRELQDRCNDLQDRIDALENENQFLKTTIRKVFPEDA